MAAILSKTFTGKGGERDSNLLLQKRHEGFIGRSGRWRAEALGSELSAGASGAMGPSFRWEDIVACEANVPSSPLLEFSPAKGDGAGGFGET